jgi:hypothetical protein
LSERKIPGNPFRYGREADVLVDRGDELARVVRVGEECGTLFLIGPRRFGKTCQSRIRLRLRTLRVSHRDSRRASVRRPRLRVDR